MPQMPTPGPRKPPVVYGPPLPPKPQVYGPPLPPKAATPSPTPTRPQPTQEEWEGIQAQQRSSTGPQQRRFRGSYEKQKLVDNFPGIDALRQDPEYQALDAAGQHEAEQLYHQVITRNRTQYKSDSTAGQQGAERAQDRTAQREARIQGNRNVEYVRRGMGLSGQPEYATDTRWESQSRPGNVLGNVLNNSMLGQGIEAITGQAPFRTGEAQGQGEQLAELGGSVITGLAEFGGMGAIGSRLGGSLARAALGRAVTPAFAASELAAPLVRGAEGLAANIAGNMVPQIPGISNAVGRGDLTPQEGLRAIGGSALSGAAMGPVARLMPGNTLKQMLGRNAMQTAVGTADQFAQGQTPDAQSLLVDFGSGALLDARDVKINRPSWMKQVDPMRPQDTPDLPAPSATPDTVAPELPRNARPVARFNPNGTMPQNARPVARMPGADVRTAPDAQPPTATPDPTPAAPVAPTLDTSGLVTRQPGGELPNLPPLPQPQTRMPAAPPRLDTAGLEAKSDLPGPVERIGRMQVDPYAGSQQQQPIPAGPAPRVSMGDYAKTRGAAMQAQAALPGLQARKADLEARIPTMKGAALTKATKDLAGITKRIEAAQALVARVGTPDPGTVAPPADITYRDGSAFPAPPPPPVAPAPKAKVKPTPAKKSKTKAKAQPVATAPAVDLPPAPPPVVAPDAPVPPVSVKPEPVVATAQKAKSSKAAKAVKPESMPAPTKPESTTAPTKAAKPAAAVKGEPAVKPDTPTDGDTLPTTGRDKLKKGDLVKTKYGDIARIVKRSVIEGNVYYDLKFESGEDKGSTAEEYPHNLISAKMTEMGGGTMPKFNTDDVVRLGDAIGHAARNVNQWADRKAVLLSKPVMEWAGFKMDVNQDGERRYVWDATSDRMGARGIRAINTFLRAHIADPVLRHHITKWLGNKVAPAWRWFNEQFRDGAFRKSTAYEAHIDAKMEANEYRQFFSDALPKMAEMSDDDLTTLNKVLTGELSDKQWNAVAKPLRDKIDELSAKLLDVGMISQEMYDRGVGSYMHRTYNENATGLEADLKRAQRRLGTVASVLKTRGIWITPAEAFPVKKTLDALEKVGTSKTGNQLVKWVDGKTYEVRGEQLWRDYTPEERAKMGEITNAAFNLGNTLVLAAKNLESGRFYDTISKDAKHAQAQPAFTDRTSRKAWEDKMKADGWQKLPGDTLGDSGIKKYGRLGGMWVSPEVHQFIKGQDAVSAWSKPGTARGAIQRYIVRPWKVAKTALNLASHVTNMATNMIIYDLHDADLKHIATAVRAIVFGKGSPEVMAMLRDAKAKGSFGDSMAAVELRQIKEAGFDLSAFRKATDNPEGFVKRLGALVQAINATRKADGLKAAGKEAGKRAWDATVDNTANGIDLAQRAYGSEDDIFRFALYLDRMDKGMTNKQAAHAAREGFVNYDIHAPGIIAMKNSAWPFISYTYRATPLVMKMYKDRPWKTIKHAAYLGLMNTIGSALNAAMAPEGATTEGEERASMEWNLIDSMTKLRTPFRDDKGGSRYWDVSKYFPLADLAEWNDSTALPLPIPKKLMPSGPVWMPGEFIFNEYDAGYGPKEITNKAKTRMDQAGDFYEWVKRQAEPGVAFQAEKLWKVWNGQKTQLGQDESVLGTAANAFVKLPRVEPQEQIQMRARALKAKQMENAAIIRDRARQIQRDGGDRSELKPTAMKYNGLSQQMARDFGEYLRRIRAKREQ